MTIFSAEIFLRIHGSDWAQFEWKFMVFLMVSLEVTKSEINVAF